MVPVLHSLVSVIVAGLSLCGPVPDARAQVRAQMHAQMHAQAQQERQDSFRPNTNTPGIGPRQAERLLDAAVITHAGQPVGRVEAVCMSEMEVVQLIVALSGATGSQAKTVAVEYRDVELRTANPPTVYVANEEKLRSLPSYQYGDPKHRGAVFNPKPATGGHGAARSCAE